MMIGGTGSSISSIGGVKENTIAQRMNVLNKEIEVMENDLSSLEQRLSIVSNRIPEVKEKPMGSPRQSASQLAEQISDFTDRILKSQEWIKRLMRELEI